MTVAADAVLDDGTRVHVRPIGPDDADALRRFHAQLSPKSVYFRFFAPYPELRECDVSLFTHVDHVNRVALVVTREDAILGVARYDRMTDPAAAEIAFVVRDDVQGHGIGTLLLERLAVAARAGGVQRFVALVLPENIRMRALLADSGYASTATFSDGYLTMELSIEEPGTISSTSSTGRRGVDGISGP